MTGSRRRGAVLLALAALVVVAFHVLGAWYDGFALALGTIDEPTPRHLLFLSYFTLYGSLTALLLAAGIAATRPSLGAWEGWEERSFLVASVALALLVPIVLRVVVLGDVPITDDEGLYRFGAQLLLEGRVTAPSHPLKLFFDHGFFVNDGRMFSQYFLGWPAFLAVGVALGVPGFVNAALSAATVPALYLLTRRLAGRVWAQVTVAVFLTSPMLQLLAATELAHTSELAALTWTAWLAHRAADDPARARPAALLGLAFSVAFFIRPLTALGIGAPFLVLWAVRWLRGGRSARGLLAFGAPALVLAGLFLLVNHLQTGSPLRPAYVAWQDYARENAFRFSGLNPETASQVPNLAPRGWSDSLRTLSAGVTRLNYALLGWPSAFLFLPLAWWAGGTAVFWGAIGLFLLLHLPLHDAGIDTVGPVHFTELALPVLVLTAIGLRRGTEWLEGRELPGRRIGLAAVQALVLCGLLLYTPYRLRAVSVVGTLVNVPFRALEASGIGNAVVFVAPPFTARCNPAVRVPSRPFVLWWPVNEPDFGDDVVYANHLSVEADRELMEHFPGRTGWIQHWRNDCTLAFIPLAEASPEAVPPAMMIRTSDEAWFFDERHPLTGEVPPGFDPAGGRGGSSAP